MDINYHTSEFKRKIIAQGGDFKTAETYAGCMALLFNYYKSKHDSPLHIPFRDLEDYIIYLSEEDYSPSYINQFIAASKRFYSINNQSQKCSGLKYHNNPIQSPNVLTYDECIKMCEAPIYIKHQAIINLLFYGGLRRSELIDLKIEHISKDGKLTILNSKFGKSRVIPLPEAVMNLLRRYYLQCKPKEYLFNGDKGRIKYSTGSVRNIIRDTARKCGIHKRTYPHLMRASMATILLDNGASLDYVSWWLGHEKIETTYRHYHKLTIKSMREQFDGVLNKLKQKGNIISISQQQRQLKTA